MSQPVFKELKKSRKSARSGILNIPLQNLDAPQSDYRLLRSGFATGQARTAKVKTPFFMPVATRGAVKGLEPAQVAETGAQVLLANTYHLHLTPGEKTVKNLGGLHSFSGWKGPMLTDSGGFQVFSLAKVRKITEEGVVFKEDKSGRETLITPEKSMQIQLDLGADIIMAFDDVTGLSTDEIGRSEEAMERTHRWLERCITEFNRITKKMDKPPLLFGIVQGGLNRDLRRKSLEFVQSTSVSGVAIGGLAVGETRAEMYKMLDFLAPLYDGRPRYLMGVGPPADVRYAIERGIDMMDCVLPTRNARHGQVWVRNGCTASSCQRAKPATPKWLAAQSVVKASGAPSEYRRTYTSVRSSAFPSSASACSRCGEPFDRRLNLTNSQFAADPLPIDKNCDCHTCRPTGQAGKTGYSRAYLRQLFKTDNSLGGSLASIHNLRYLNRIFESYR